MANYTLSPSPFQHFFLADGITPNANGRVYTYLAGLSTPATTYSTSGGIANSNPIILDGAGQCSIFLSPGSYGYAIYADPLVSGLDTSGGLIETQDNIASTGSSISNNSIPGIAGETLTDGDICYLSDGSAGKTQGRWYLAKADNTYSSTTPMLGFCVGGLNAGVQGSFLLAGQLTSGISVTVGQFYYISSATAGEITATKPTLFRIVGFADSGTSMVVFPNPPGAPGYEAALWTPTLAGTGGQSGQVYSSREGRYIKIGQFVWASGYIALTTLGTITGALQITGLPYAADSGVLQINIGTLAWADMTSTYVNMIAYVAQGSTVIVAGGITAASATALTAIAQGDLSNTSKLYVSVSYRTAS